MSKPVDFGFKRSRVRGAGAPPSAHSSYSVCGAAVDVQVLNLFLALLLSSFGAESFQHSQEDSEPNKLQEAADRISRVVNFVRLHAIAFWTEMQRQRKRTSLAGQCNVDDSSVGTSFDAKLYPTSIIGPAAAAAAAASPNTGAVSYNGPNVIVDIQPSGTNASRYFLRLSAL